MSDYLQLPPDLPVPEDDGAADHLEGLPLPPLLAQRGAELLVAYVYPRTGVPGVPLPADWDDIPGARGCTPESCAYRDALAEFEALGAAVVGISAQSAEEQAAFVAREQIPFPLISDAGLSLARELRLPTFEVEGLTPTSASPSSPRRARSSRSSTPSSRRTATRPRCWAGCGADGPARAATASSPPPVVNN